MYSSISGEFLVFDELQVLNCKRSEFAAEKFRVSFLMVGHRK